MEEAKTVETQKTGVLFSPEGAIMLGAAGFLDLLGLVDSIPGIGQMLSYIPDFLGIFIIGGWTLYRSQTMKTTHRATQRLGKAAKMGRRLKWLRPLLILGEFVPIAGIAPLWLLVVYLELKS